MRPLEHKTRWCLGCIARLFNPQSGACLIKKAGERTSPVLENDRIVVLVTLDDVSPEFLKITKTKFWAFGMKIRGN